MKSTHYSISADSRRWWWPSAAAGVVASAAIAAIVTVPAGVGHAIPDTDPALGTGSAVGQSAAAPSDEVAHGRPCFLVRPRWNTALDGPQPVCGITWGGGDQPRLRTRPAFTPKSSEAECPPPPDIRYVGMPWVPPEPTGCVSIDRWWTVVTPQ